MNEALLIILILITGITFFNLVKKVGVSAPLAAPVLHQNNAISYAENFGNIIYSGSNGNSNPAYNNLWSVTATTGVDNDPVLDKITVVYHQHKNVKNMLDYGGSELQSTREAALIPADVCVSSNISDIQYRHVLLEMK